jgi:SAM-dependent methyltransferase
VDCVENHASGEVGSHSGYTLGHPFDRSGLAAVSDLDAPEVRAIFRQLESVQEEFLAKEGSFRSAEYRWPRDPLHNWSRCWEYPYAFRQLQSFRGLAPGKEKFLAADLGSGVTFFPFAAARLGYEVVCTDTDLICDKDLSRAIPAVPHAPGKVSFRLINGDRLPFADGELDLVFCISVLEHIPNFPNTIREIARVLKPGGWLILTIDLDLRGDQEIGIGPYQLLLRELTRDFDVRLPEVSIHPRDLLKTLDGPYPWPVRRGFERYWFLLKQNFLKPIFGKKPTPLIPFYLTVKGMTLIRK